MADIFLSYARRSEKTAKLVAGALRESGYSVWFDESLPAHRLYSEVIEEQLESSRAVLVLWSNEAVHSQWVRSEANRARESGRLVQARLDDARLPMPFDQIHCSDLSRWQANLAAPSWQNVVTSVADLVDRQPSNGEMHPGAPGTFFNRRLMLAGSTAAVATVAAGAFAIWRSFGPAAPSDEAQLLLEKGMDALQSNDAFDPNSPADAAQAIAILSNATRVAPDLPTAWGALAMAYAVRKKGAPPSERAGFDARSRSAAKRALELDPREPRAIGALRMLDPVYRKWLAAERADREALNVQPRMPLLLFLLADVLGNTGRWGEAAELSKSFDRKKFLIAGADRQVIFNLWSAGDLPGADDALGLAIQHWPQHPQIWRTRVQYLMFSGRALDALKLLRDHSERPPGTSDEYVQALEATASALAGQGDAKAALERIMALLRTDSSLVFLAAHVSTALDDAKTALALLRGYYFQEADWARLAPVGGDQDRQTAPLFQPPMRNLWKQRDFDTLLERIGLNNYWRRSGTQPDFRKA